MPTLKNKWRGSMKRALRPCGEIGCNELTRSGYCEQHQKQYHRERDQYRESSSKRGYDYQWQKYRRGFLRRHPLCVSCTARGRTVPATDVDHIKPHRGDKELFWNPSNHQALCKSCHSRKTALGG